MDLFNVYPLMDIDLQQGEGCYVADANGQRYLDLYGGHAVISIGHGHPHYVRRIEEQLHQLGFYSNSVVNYLQLELAERLGKLSSYAHYSLFLCSSGAEANENALKLASFHTGKSKVVAFQHAFHGRTSAAVAVTDNPRIQAPINRNLDVVWLPMNDAAAVEQQLQAGDVCAVIIEGIQGVGGIIEPGLSFLYRLEELCRQYGAVLILDEVQSGYGRSGYFFAHQHAGITPHLITMAKGMGNGFPVGGMLIGPEFEASYGLLGTTFGGNHLACAAALAVLEVMEEEELIENAAVTGTYLINALKQVPAVQAVRGKGLMVGIDFGQPIKALRHELVHNQHIFTGNSANPNVLRLLPPLSITKYEVDYFLEKLNTAIQNTIEL